MAEFKTQDLVTVVRKYLDAKDTHDREVKRWHGELAAYRAHPAEVALFLNETRNALLRAESVLREEIALREGASHG